jgi:Aminotransferase class-V
VEKSIVYIYGIQRDVIHTQLHNRKAAAFSHNTLYHQQHCTMFSRSILMMRYQSVSSMIPSSNSSCRGSSSSSSMLTLQRLYHNTCSTRNTRNSSSASVMEIDDPPSLETTTTPDTTTTTTTTTMIPLSTFTPERMASDARYVVTQAPPSPTDLSYHSMFSIRNQFRTGRAAYLDMSSTTPMDPRVFDCMIPYMMGSYGNPHSRTHQFGWESEQIVEQARTQVASLIHADAKEIIFTSGATECNNMAIKGAAHFYSKRGKHYDTNGTQVCLGFLS